MSNSSANCDLVVNEKGQTVEKPCSLESVCFYWDLDSWVNAAKLELAATTAFRLKMNEAEAADLASLHAAVSNLSRLNIALPLAMKDRVMEAVHLTQQARCLRAAVVARMKGKPVPKGPERRPVPSDPGKPVAPKNWTIPGLPGVKIPVGGLADLLKALLPIIAIALAGYAFVVSAPARKSRKALR